MKKTDLILIAAVLLIAAAIILGNKILDNNRESNYYAEVVIGRDVIDRLPLDAAIEKTYETADGVNILVIEEGKCFIKEADCYNQICVNSLPISQVGESIVCMPHKLAVTIVESK